ncbi:MAG: hypothetical protein APF80_08640 [Alphaproteobacteria bacterium BRH_c36]|nr:MAG: hypothetical protein APF80_08640 [Alphaproteobacteria bacterium BRH_c36]
MQNTGEDWKRLLGVLTEEELAQYAQMALDQVRRETSRAALHVALLLSGVGLMGWAGWTIYRLGEVGSLVYLALAAAGVCIYIPWRSVKTRKLWLGHYVRVKQELSRRQDGGEGSKRET